MNVTVKTVIYSDIKVRNRASFFASPVAWATANLTQLLINEESQIDPYHTGMIVVSDECSLATINELSDSASRGSISPLRFAGSSPSIVTGLSALEQGIRGPTLAFTMPPKNAAIAIIAMIDYWISYNEITSVIVITHHRRNRGDHILKGLIARSADKEVREKIVPLCQIK